jgi:hypothetical protein
MSQARQRHAAFAIGARVSHQEHGDGTVMGTYGSAKLSVNFDNSHTKRVPRESLTLAAPMSAEELASVLRERDARRAKARAEFAEQQSRREQQVQPTVFHPDDFKLESFDWKLVPPGSPFWEYWNSDKEGIKASGFRVTKDGRDWLVRKDAVAVQAPAVAEAQSAPIEHAAATAQIIQFPRSRIVRLIVGGKPVDEAAGNEAA